MAADNLWVVLHATALNGSTLQMPKAVGELIGLRADLPGPGNGIAFLDRGPGVARVMAMADPSVGATKESTDALIAVATPTKRLVFSLPKRVRDYLGLGWRPVIAWAVPASAWEKGDRRALVCLIKATFLVRAGSRGREPEHAFFSVTDEGNDQHPLSAD